NIGAGKTTLTQLLSKHYKWIPQFEEVDDNPYLDDFYYNMKKWAFNLQIYFLGTRFKQIKEIRESGKNIIQDRTIYEDAYIFAANLHDMGLIETRDYQNYLNLFNLMNEYTQAPDLLIYLKASVPTLVNQIQKRGREYEAGISIDYLSKLNEKYENWIDSYSQGPRYTSYPTVPFWEFDKFTKNDWIQTLKKSFNESNIKEGISIYIHLPYCESLCTFCACHKRITKNHSVEEKYIKYLIKEWDLYLSLFNEKPVIKELHLGGGTPTFFSPNNLKTLLNHIYNSSIIHQNKEFSIEGHPNNTSFDHLRTLFDLGFSRISFGVQDYDPQIQRAINRIQPFENVKKVTELAKSIGYKSISHDLVFGLPFQTLEKTLETIRLTKSLKPDRMVTSSENMHRE
ncbi:unnamed protein product, partial [Darwinula stevensoni]